VVVGYATSGFDISRDVAGVAREVHVAAATCVEMQRTARPNLWLHPMVGAARSIGVYIFFPEIYKSLQLVFGMHGTFADRACGGRW
jgi:hypothetical protein